MKILVLTSEYPGPFKDPENNITPVVHFFAKEWKKMNHEVLVINNALRYPLIAHLLPLNIKRLITRKIGFSIMGLDYIKLDDYYWEGIHVYRFPVLKMIPHGDHPRWVINRQIKKIIHTVEDESFSPDLIICHWPSPQMQIVGALKQHFGCKCALTFHGLGYLNSNRFNYNRYIKDIDAIGFRNISDAIKAKSILRLDYNPYVCLSGVPEEYMTEYNVSASKMRIDSSIRIVYVGRLVERKHVDTILKALLKSNISNFQFDIIGTGPCENDLIDLARRIPKSKGVVNFHGRISREEVMKYNKDAHIFVMTSEKEAFGLVYLEAMAAKCITIGSIGEGIDGIIKNGENGFLVNPGSENDLIQVFDALSTFSEEQLVHIANNAYRTVSEMTDSKIAYKYLGDVCKLLGINSSTINYDVG